MNYLTKSKYLLGLQCAKLLWINFHEKDKIPEHSASTLYTFEQGHIIGELAKKLFPDGIEVPQEDFIENINKTKELIKLRKPLFEAGFMIYNLFSRVDILNPVNNDEWDIIEVKSGTQVKEINVHDVSFQKYVYEKSGLKIRKCFLMHINNQYVKQGEINPKDLFTLTEITSEVEELMEEIEGRIINMEDVINSNINPDVTIGRHCKNPYDCPMEDECWGFLPENHVFNLYRGGKTSEELFNMGTRSIYEIPSEFKLNDKQQIQWDCEQSKKPFIHKESIRHFLKTLHYPLFYLDFETINPVIPLYDGMKCYQRIPFQFSLHIVQKDGSTKHHEFLAEGKEDPRPKFLEELKKGLEGEGSIVVYNEAFEKGVLKELAESFPEYKNWVENIFTRVVDLLIPFRNFHYYNPVQKGSASIKKVLPALTGKSYSDLDISGGSDASVSYLNVTFKEISDEEREKVRKDLLKYCGLDTEGMIWIVDRLKELIK